MRMAVSLVHAHVVNGGLGRLEWQQLCRCHQRMSTEYVGCVYDVWDIPDVEGQLARAWMRHGAGEIVGLPKGMLCV